MAEVQLHKHLLYDGYERQPGEFIDPSDEVAKDLIARGLAGEPGSYSEPEPVLEAAGGDAGTPVDELTAWYNDANAGDIVARVGAEPDIAPRILELEQAQKKPRKTVLEAAGGDAS